MSSKCSSEFFHVRKGIYHHSQNIKANLKIKKFPMFCMAMTFVLLQFYFKLRSPKQEVGRCANLIKLYFVVLSHSAVNIEHCDSNTGLEVLEMTVSCL